MIETPWTREERSILSRLSSPAAVQAFLDRIPYSADPIYRCPRSVMRDRKAHCFDGAVFAAAAMARLGHEPMLLDMGAVRDDDHVLALFWKGARVGAVAKSNFVGLRYREPIYRDLRELVMSYFEAYFNAAGEKTLRTYSAPVRLGAFGELRWTTDDEAMDAVAIRLDGARHYRLLSRGQERALSRMDPRSLEAGMVGVDEAGLYKPGG